VFLSHRLRVHEPGYARWRPDHRSFRRVTAYQQWGHQDRDIRSDHHVLVRVFQPDKLVNEH